MKRLPDSRGVRTSAEINAPRNRFAARSPAGTRVPPVRSFPVIPVVPGHRALRPPTLVIGRRSPDDRSTVLSRDATAVAGYRDKGLLRQEGLCSAYALGAGRGVLRHDAKSGMDHGPADRPHRASPAGQTTLLRLLDRQVHSVYGPSVDTGACRSTTRRRSTRTPISHRLITGELQGGAKAALPGPASQDGAAGALAPAVARARGGVSSVGPGDGGCAMLGAS